MKNYLCILLAIFFLETITAQTLNLEQDIDDGKALVKAYIAPFADGIGASLNNGWYNTAKPHKLGGFDVTFTLNTVMVPDAAKSFNINDVVSSNSNFSSSSEESSTFLGNENGSKISYSYQVGNQNETEEFDMPKGLGLSVVPLPMLQAGVGIIKETEIDIRYMPEQKIGNLGAVNLIGFGAKHDILQWLPFIGDAIPISLSLQGGYTNLNTSFEIQDKEVNLDIKATTINLIASRKVLMLTGYAGLGYNSSTTTFSTDGEYAIGTSLGAVKFESDELSNFKFESQNEFRANIGIRFNITVIALQANYTISKYPTATIGLGISLR